MVAEPDLHYFPWHILNGRTSFTKINTVKAVGEIRNPILAKIFGIGSI